MYLGILLIHPDDHAQTIAIKAIVRAYGLSLIIREGIVDRAASLSISEVGKFPILFRADGSKLFDYVAITLYG
jgi:hypothetical protein